MYLFFIDSINTNYKHFFFSERDALSPHVSQSPRFSVPTFPHVWTDGVTDYI